MSTKFGRGRISRAFASWASALVVMGCLAANAGCGGHAAAGGKVEHAQLYRSGNGDYDDFFEDLHDLQNKPKADTDEERAARGPLVEAMGASDALDDLVKRVRERAEELAQSKQKIRFEFDGLDDQGQPVAGRPVTVKPLVKGRAVPKEALQFASVLEAATRSEGQVWEKYSPLADRVRNMTERATALLERVDAEFPPNKRDEVKGELKTAKSVLEQAGIRADKIVAASAKFLKGITEAVGAAASAEPKSADPKKEKAGKDKDRKPVNVGKAPRPSQASASKSRETPSEPPKASAGATKAAGHSGGRTASASAGSPSPATPPTQDFNP